MADVADLFRRVTTGIYVIGVAEGERRNAFTAAWLTQVSFDPLLLALSVNPEAFGTHSGRDQDKLAGIPWRPAASGAPILTQGLAWLDCRLRDRFPAGDHEIILARPVAGELVAPDASPLLYPDTGELDGSRELYPKSL
jgi:flavin reductase (DIM6/NTAB) family NADH-FMN oxidoreductase RutF